MTPSLDNTLTVPLPSHTHTPASLPTEAIGTALPESLLAFAKTHAALLDNVAAIAITCGLFVLTGRLHRLLPRLWTSPLFVTPAVLIAALSAAHLPYQRYMTAAQPLLWMIGPLTLAFAIPVYQHRAYIREWWPALLVGTVVSTVCTMGSAWGLAHAFGLPEAMTRSLIGRSISLPFAFVLSDMTGGTRELTTIFVVASGIVGIVLGDLFLHRIGLRSEQAPGATLGAVAQVVGAARAHQQSVPRGVMASLTMIFAGALSVVIAMVLPLLPGVAGA